MEGYISLCLKACLPLLRKQSSIRSYQNPDKRIFNCYLIILCSSPTAVNRQRLRFKIVMSLRILPTKPRHPNPILDITTHLNSYYLAAIIHICREDGTCVYECAYYQNPVMLILGLDADKYYEYQWEMDMRNCC